MDSGSVAITICIYLHTLIYINIIIVIYIYIIIRNMFIPFWYGLSQQIYFIRIAFELCAFIFVLFYFRESAHRNTYLHLHTHSHLH